MAGCPALLILSGMHEEILFFLSLQSVLIQFRMVLYFLQKFFKEIL